MENDPQELERRFAELAELAPDARRQALHELAGRQPALARRLAALLDAHERAGEGTQWPGGLFAALGGFDADALIGRELDGWRLLSLLGRGGMGMVYAAERDDGGVRQQAAVKLLAVPMFDARAGERFMHEAQLLARLEHPGICRLRGWGRTPEQWPYLVLDLVRGQPLDAFMDGSRPVRERIALMAKVADAVAAAHRQLVAHLDLKPANIIVVDGERPVLLDFGIARALGEDAQAGATMTRWLTPDYASPEQLRGEPATAAADIYALGALLYQACTGQRPFELGGLSLAAALERIGQGAEPPRRRVPSLPRDLDAICARAMHADPARRYATADALAEDLRALLDARPVRARPDSLGYRLRKLLQRHPLALPASVAAVVATASLAVLLALQSQSLRQQRDLAEREAARARSASSLLLDSIRAVSPGNEYGDDVRVAAMVDAAAARAERELAGVPLLHADVLVQLGDLRRSLGQYDAAVALYEQALGRYEAAGTESRRAQRLASVGRVEALRGAERVAEAVSLAEATLAGFADGEASAAAAAGDDAPGRLWLALGQARLAQSGHDAAEAALNQALLLLPEAEAAARAQSMLAMGALMSARSRDEESLDWYRRALEAVEGVEAERVLVAGIHDETAYSLSRRELHDEALQSIARAKEIRTELFGEDHPVIVTTLTTEMLVLDAAGRWDEALAVADRALALEQAISTGESRRMERLLSTKGTVLRRLGRSGEAFSLHERALELAERHYPPVHRMLANAYSNLGVMHADAGDYAASYRHTLRAWEVYRDLAGKDPPLRGGIIAAANLANCMQKLERPDEAVEWATRALQDAEQVMADSWIVPNIRNILARSLLASGRPSEAEVQALEVKRRYDASPTPVQPSARRNNAELLADIYRAIGQAAKEREFRALATSLQPSEAGG